MSIPRSWLASSVLVLSALAPAARAQQTLTYKDLVRRMTNLERLAELPAPGETCGQWSSYDRASKYDAASGKYIHWDANGDGDGIIRREGDRVVMAEMKGPGCIWRIWSAAAGQGHVKIYLDDQPQPTLDLPFIAYFDGKHPPLAYPALSYDMTKTGSAGQNLYLPIPYQKSCKVVAEKNWGQYYHFTYATYPPGTRPPRTPATWRRSITASPGDWASTGACARARRSPSRGSASRRERRPAFCASTVRGPSPPCGSRRSSGIARTR